MIAEIHQHASNPNHWPYTTGQDIGGRFQTFSRLSAADVNDDNRVDLIATWTDAAAAGTAFCNFSWAKVRRNVE